MGRFDVHQQSAHYLCACFGVTTTVAVGRQRLAAVGSIFFISASPALNCTSRLSMTTFFFFLSCVRLCSFSPRQVRQREKLEVPSVTQLMLRPVL